VIEWSSGPVTDKDAERAEVRNQIPDTRMKDEETAEVEAGGEDTEKEENGAGIVADRGQKR